MPYITVVPAVRTIPGVEEFDYAVDDSADIQPGDVLRVPFRKHDLPAMVVSKNQNSAFASRAIAIGAPPIFLRLGESAPMLLRAAAHRTFTSLPSVCAAWIRAIPKRATPCISETRVSPRVAQTSVRETHYLERRWHDALGLLSAARASSGRTLIITPWQHRADILASTLGARVLHADLADGAAWSAIQHFCQTSSSTLVASRIGAWLACVADTVIIDEPENDDHKQDELSPRIDVRWLIEHCAEIRPNMSVRAFGTTPRLNAQADWPQTPNVSLELQTEIKLRRGSSAIEGLTAQTVNAIAEALETQSPVSIIHPIVGDRARVACRDCGWSSVCEACSFPLTNANGTGLCRKCGHKQQLPELCPQCGGADLARSAAGRDHLAAQCHTTFASNHLRVHTLADLQATALPRHGLVIITDVSLIGGVIEDTRRRERLVIAWRRLASVFAASGSRVLIQGAEEALADCRAWLTSEGVQATWKTEYAERKLFGYPPALRMAKLLVDGTAATAQTLFDDLTAVAPGGWRLQGPFPVPYRAKTRSERQVIQLVTSIGVPDDTLYALLNPFKSRAIIDLDPIAFFA